MREDVGTHTGCLIVANFTLLPPQAAGSDVPPLLPANSPFKPMAQRIKEFQNKTPVRFRTRPGPAMPVRKMEMTDAKVHIHEAGVVDIRLPVHIDFTAVHFVTL